VIVSLLAAKAFICCLFKEQTTQSEVDDKAKNNFIEVD
jgi:hypothetical protein